MVFPGALDSLHCFHCATHVETKSNKNVLAVRQFPPFRQLVTVGTVGRFLVFLPTRAHTCAYACEGGYGELSQLSRF